MNTEGLLYKLLTVFSKYFLTEIKINGFSFFVHAYNFNKEYLEFRGVPAPKCFSAKANVGDYKIIFDEDFSDIWRLELIFSNKYGDKIGFDWDFDYDTLTVSKDGRIRVTFELEDSKLSIDEIVHIVKRII